MSEQTPSKQPTAPGDPASGVQASERAGCSKQPANNPTAEELLGPPAHGDVVIDSSYHMGLLEQMGGLLRYERFGPLHDRPRVLADASTCQVYVGRRRALRVIERMQARIVELEAERDEARERAICAASSEARRIDERDIAYAALTSAAKALAANDFDLAREVLCRSSARDKAAELRRADMKHTLAAAARAEKAEARVAELEGILHDAPTIDAVESHVPGWLARVRAALGKETQT